MRESVERDTLKGIGCSNRLLVSNVKQGQKEGVEGNFLGDPTKSVNLGDSCLNKPMREAHVEREGESSKESQTDVMGGNKSKLLEREEATSGHAPRVKESRQGGEEHARVLLDDVRQSAWDRHDVAVVGPELMADGLLDPCNLGDPSDPLQKEAQVQVDFLDCNLTEQQQFSEGVGRVNNHIRFRMEDSDISEYSDSIDNLGVDQRLKKQRRKEKQRSKKGKIYPSQAGVPKCLQLVELAKSGKNKRRSRGNKNSSDLRDGPSMNFENEVEGGKKFGCALWCLGIRDCVI